MTTNPDIIITGTSGWLGSRMLMAVMHGLEDYPELELPPARHIRCFYREGDTPVEVDVPEGCTVENHFGDLASAADCDRLLEGAEGAIVFHTAGVIHPNRVRDFYSTNVEGSLNIARAASAAGARRVVLVSSNSPIGCNPEPTHRFDEESPYNPYQHYGRSKMEMEQRARWFADEAGLDLVIVRPPWFYGPNQPPRQTLFFTMIKDGGGPLVGNGLNQRSMVYIDNLCYGLILAGTVPAARGHTYWIADAEPYEMRTILDTIEAVLEDDFSYEVAHKRLKLPGIAAEVAYVIDAMMQATGLYHQKIHVLSEMNKNIACSIEGARRDLGYEPKVALREGMQRSIAWCREQGLTI